MRIATLVTVLLSLSGCAVSVTAGGEAASPDGPAVPDGAVQAPDAGRPGDAAPLGTPDAPDGASVAPDAGAATDTREAEEDADPRVGPGGCWYPTIQLCEVDSCNRDRPALMGRAFCLNLGRCCAGR